MVTSPAKSAAALSEYAHYTPGEVVADFKGLEKESGSLEVSSSAKSYLPTVAEVKDSLPPVANMGEHFFRFMADAAVDQGYITREALEHVMTALYGGGR